MTTPLISAPVQCSHCDEPLKISCRYGEQEFVAKCGACNEKTLIAVHIAESVNCLKIIFHTQPVTLPARLGDTAAARKAYTDIKAAVAA